MKTTKFFVSIIIFTFLFSSCATCNLEKATVRKKQDYTANKIVAGIAITGFASTLIIFN